MYSPVLNLGLFALLVVGCSPAVVGKPEPVPKVVRTIPSTPTPPESQAQAAPEKEVVSAEQPAAEETESEVIRQRVEDSTSAMLSALADDGKAGETAAESPRQDPPNEETVVEQADPEDEADKAAQEQAESAAARTNFLAQLGGRKLTLTPKGNTALMNLTAEIRKFEPSGTMSATHIGVTNYRGDFGVLSPFSNGVEAIARLVRYKIRREEEVDFKAPKLAKTLEEVQGFTVSSKDLPDILDLLANDALSQRHLVPYFEYLDACARDIAHHREADARLHAAISLFTRHRDRFLLLHRMTHPGFGYRREIGHFGSLTNLGGREIIGSINEHNFADDDLRNKYTEFEKTFGRSSGGSLEEKFKVEVLEPTYFEAERQRQKEMMSVFTNYEKRAIDSLVTLQGLQDKLEEFALSNVPDLKLRLPNLIKCSPDGEPDAKPLPAIEFDIIEPSEYVKDIVTFYQEITDTVYDQGAGRQRTRRLLFFCATHKLGEWFGDGP